MNNLLAGGSVDGPAPTHRPIFGREITFTEWLNVNAPEFRELNTAEEANYIGGMIFGSLRGMRTTHEKGALNTLIKHKEQQTAYVIAYEKEYPLIVVGYAALDMQKTADIAYFRSRKRRWELVHKK